MQQGSSNGGDKMPFVTNENMGERAFGPLRVSAFTHIGKRGNQEDRFTICPNLFDGELAFMGVFDGTVKEFAADFVHRNILAIFLASKSIASFMKLPKEERNASKSSVLLQDALLETFAATDAKLLQWCRDNENHYTSCTAVVVLMHVPTRRLLTAHLGDSKIILGSKATSSGGNAGGNAGGVAGVSLTTDHKPNMPGELRRIESCGGSLTWLHGGKPFIRGGDFTQRKHAMQLNYSRAFGGKDLKMYGLSAVPDVSETIIEPGLDIVVILGSDGVWDVLDATDATAVVCDARKRDHNPAEELVFLSLATHEQRRSADNVTAIVAFFQFDEN